MFSCIDANHGIFAQDDGKMSKNGAILKRALFKIRATKCNIKNVVLSSREGLVCFIPLMVSITLVKQIRSVLLINNYCIALFA